MVYVNNKLAVPAPEAYVALTVLLPICKATALSRRAVHARQILIAVKLECIVHALIQQGCIDLHASNS